MKHSERITLVLAILGAVTGSISFAAQTWEYIRFRPRVEAKLVGVFNRGADLSHPHVLVQVNYQNAGRINASLMGVPVIVALIPEDPNPREYDLVHAGGSPDPHPVPYQCLR